MPNRVLLVDGDILAFRTASSEQVEVEWFPGLWSYGSNQQTCRERVDGKLAYWTRELNIDRVVLCFSDLANNFRRNVLSSYKAHRGGKKPLGYLPLVEYCMDVYPSRRLATLEADDVLGIMHTTVRKDRETIIISADKDMRTLPGLHVDMLDVHLDVFEITPLEADRYWMQQTLTGDQADGYKGCPGIGPKIAKRILKDAESLEEMWAAVVATYQEKGLSEADALVQARVSRILRAGDYRPSDDGGQVELWNPSGAPV